MKYYDNVLIRDKNEIKMNYIKRLNTAMNKLNSVIDDMKGEFPDLSVFVAGEGETSLNIMPYGDPDIIPVDGAVNRPDAVHVSVEFTIGVDCGGW